MKYGGNLQEEKESMVYNLIINAAQHSVLHEHQDDIHSSTPPSFGHLLLTPFGYCVPQIKDRFGEGRARGFEPLRILPQAESTPAHCPLTAVSPFII
jgi:hypothetical protein